MASIFRRRVWVDAEGRRVPRGTPGAKRQKSGIYYIKTGGKIYPGYADKAATEQKAAEIQRALARGEMGLVDTYGPHRRRPLVEHIDDWVAELRQLGRDEAYARPCEARMRRLAAECNWARLDDIDPADFIAWRQRATATVGHGRVVPMSARTLNHHLATLKSFCRWAVRRKRMPHDPIADVAPVPTAGRLVRERRALSAEELGRLLAVVPRHYRLGYRLLAHTGLRCGELRQLRWGDVHLDAPHPFIQLRAETTKAKRADVIPLRADLAEELRQARGDDAALVVPVLPRVPTHRKYLAAAGIPWEDEQGRRADLHALRHTFGTLLSAAGVPPRVAMTLMRHTDLRLTMKVYADPRIFDLAGAVEKLPALGRPSTTEQAATGTDDAPATTAFGNG